MTRRAADAARIHTDGLPTHIVRRRPARSATRVALGRNLRGYAPRLEPTWGGLRLWRRACAKSRDLLEHASSPETRRRLQRRRREPGELWLAFRDLDQV